MGEQRTLRCRLTQRELAHGGHAEAALAQPLDDRQQRDHRPVAAEVSDPQVAEQDDRAECRQDVPDREGEPA